MGRYRGAKGKRVVKEGLTKDRIFVRRPETTGTSEQGKIHTLIGAEITTTDPKGREEKGYYGERHESFSAL